jgi:hypothetical protein
LSSDGGQLIGLTAIGSTAATEISISDARFNQVELPNNAGRVEVDLPVGMYKITFREGDAAVERMASLLPGTQPVTIEQDAPAEFASAAPLADTRTTHEWQQGRATELTEAPPTTSIGTGAAELVIFVRDVGEPIEVHLDERERRRIGLSEDVELRLELESGVARRLPDQHKLGALDPTEGLTLHHLSGAPLSDVVPLDPGSRTGGLRAEVDRGTYRLRLDTGADLVLELPVTCPGGWQTEVFLLCKTYGKTTEIRRADLDSASVSMCPPGSRFDPTAPRRRLTEIALHALASRRPLQGPELTQILQDKFEDPMLGILGAHLLTLVDKPDLGLLETVINNTEGLLGRHPDIDAIKLRRELLAPSVHLPPTRLESPPTLVASWDAVVAATRRDPDVVPSGSLCDLIADKLTYSGPWLVWTAPTEHDPPPLHASSEAVRELAELLDDPTTQESVRQLDTVTPTERALATSIQPAGDPFYRQLEQLGLVEGAPKPTVEELSERLTLPVHSVCRIAAQLLQKLR